MSLDPAEQSAAVSLISRYARSVDATDIAGVLQCFTDDVSLSYEGGRLLVNGQPEAEAFSATRFGGLRRTCCRTTVSNEPGLRFS